MEKDPDFQSPKRKQRKQDLHAQTHFATAVSDQEMAVISKGYVSLNTQKNTDWAVKCFQEWVSA